VRTIVSKRHSSYVALLFASLLLGLGRPNAKAQVSPEEITNPRLKAAEGAYFSQIMALYRAVPSIHTPLPFELSRYVGLDPKQEAGTDSRGIEFVNFHNRVLLKISGNYNAAYNPDLLTQNERAAHVFSEVISPIAGLLAKEFPQDMDCDGIGFEMSYHIRVHRNFDYEGKEILVVVFDRHDAFAFATETDADRQEILNRSDIYVNGKEFGLALNQRNPLDLEAIGKETPASADHSTASVRRRAAKGGKEPALSAAALKIETEPASKAIHSAPGITRASTDDQPRAVATATPPSPALQTENRFVATAEDAERLQSQFQAQLDTLASLGKANWYFVDYAPPSFGLYQNELVLQLTLRNTMQFSPDSSSIYKRAAQSFDLFLARELKNILEKVPPDANFDAYDITVLNRLGPDSQASSEAIEYISPRKVLQQFVDAEISGQQVIDQSVVLVNGVRIALNLQLVE
jgi:hypothetical protein